MYQKQQNLKGKIICDPLTGRKKTVCTMWLYTVCQNIKLKSQQQAVTQASHYSLMNSTVADRDKINITMTCAGIIRTNCLDKVSNVEQLDVLNGPVMTAEHVGHMDGPHWDLTVGKGPNALISTEREAERGRMNERRALSRVLQDKPDFIPIVLHKEGLYECHVKCETGILTHTDTQTDQYQYQWVYQVIAAALPIQPTVCIGAPFGVCESFNWSV